MNDNENDFIQMIKDTGKLIADRKINDLSSRAIALRENNVDDNVKILRCLNKSFQTKQNNQIALSDVNLKTFSLKMSKSGLNGCIYGMTKEMLYSFKAWKNWDISGDEYFSEILKAGGESAFTVAFKTGLMIPVSSVLTAAGISTLITIPIGFVVAGSVNKIVAPIFGRGEYRQILSEAKYYQSIKNFYDDMIVSMKNFSEHYIDFIGRINSQRNIHENMKSVSMNLNKSLEAIYNSI